MHEAARSGKVEMLRRILKLGVDKNLLTYTGLTPLNIAKQYMLEDHEMIPYLESIGAKDISPSRSKIIHEDL